MAIQMRDPIWNLLENWKIVNNHLMMTTGKNRNSNRSAIKSQIKSGIPYDAILNRSKVIYVVTGMPSTMSQNVTIAKLNYFQNQKATLI